MTGVPDNVETTILLMIEGGAMGNGAGIESPVPCRLVGLGGPDVTVPDADEPDAAGVGKGAEVCPPVKMEKPVPKGIGARGNTGVPEDGEML